MIKKVLSVLLIFLLVVSGAGFLVNSSHFSLDSSSGGIRHNYTLADVKALRVPSTSGLLSTGAFSGKMEVMVSFNFTNSSMLQNYLSNLSNPASIQYHDYLSSAEFDRLFGQPASFYRDAVNYFKSMGNVQLKSFSDHLNIALIANSSYFASVFNAPVLSYKDGQHMFFSVSGNPVLPDWLAKNVTGIVGLSNKTEPGISLGTGYGSSPNTGLAPQTYANYPVPLSSSGVQFVWGSDMQRAYNVQKILNITQPTKQAIATILWSGKTNTSTPTGPFYPADIYRYFNDTLPGNQPKPKIYGIPLNGAPAPGISASYDSTDASFENTLDLEMAGSLAPGASIYNVYTSSNTFAALDQCFAYIVNGSDPALSNVSTISNSWYSGSFTDPGWNASLVKAEALGITVLAASGDSGNNKSSPKYAGADAAFPGTTASDSFGMVSVGGTTVKLSTTQTPGQFLKLTNQSAWYMPGPNTTGKTPVGSQGGIDVNISEPSWQLNSVANNLIQGKGRGVPDIGGLANNTVIYITIDGVSYYDSPRFYYAWGTSIASPLEAGLLATMNAYLIAHGGTRLGFVDPLLYKFGNLQYGTAHGNILSENKSFLLPYYDVLYGRNAIYSEVPGYSLVTGLGSINAYNMATDILNNFTTLVLYTVNVSIILNTSQQILDIYINTQHLPWTTNAFSLFLTNGTYSYNVTLKNGTRNTYSTGQFIVNGSSKDVVIHLTNETTLPASPLIPNKSTLLTIVIFLILIVIVASLFMRRRK